MQNFRSAIYLSDIFPNLSLEKWQSQGQPTAADRLRSSTLELIDGLQPPGDHDDLLAKGSRFIESLHLM